MTVVFFVAIFLSCSVTLAAAQTNATDQAALIAFWKGITNKASLWNTTAPTGLCGQFGVACNENGKMIQLTPSSSGLAGTIATQLGLLTSLNLL